MNSEYIPSTSGKSFLPLTLISLSVIFFFVWQLKMISENRTNLQTNKSKLEDFVSNNSQKVLDQETKAKQVESSLEKLVMDLLEAAKTDPDAKAIVNKYNIKQQAPAATPAP
jgi:hypothetical protein